ncbi:MAG: DUF3014 domain-containing protein [Pseudomonadota bacterium]
MGRKILVPVLIVIAGLIAIAWMLRQQPATAPAPGSLAPPVAAPVPDKPQSHPVIRDEAAGSVETTPAIATAREEAGSAQIPVIAIPPQLDDSDAYVLQAATELNPQVTGWLIPQEQLRKWVMLVNLVAEGKFPVKERPLSYDLQPFRARKENDRFWLDAASFSRKDVLVSALTTIPPSRAADYFHAWEPLLQRAHDELGIGGQFRDRLQLAITRVNSVQPLQGDVELKQSIISYQYLDPILEQSSALEKLLWRLGPDNSARLQAYLKQLAPLL